MEKPWESQVEPFRMIGNLYFVGCRSASSHLIDTGDGLILIDSGYPQTLYMVVDGIYRMGFDPRDVKYIVHTHGHYDHCGATKAFVERFGGKTIIGKGDENYVNGKEDLTWAKELGHFYHEAFEADRIVSDGETLTLGNTTITFLSTPGHTPGTMSLFFHVEEDGKRYLAGMHGGVGSNSMCLEWLDSYGLSHDCRQQFLEGIERLKQIPVEVFLGNHCGNNDTIGKGARVGKEAKNPFIDPEGWLTFLEQRAQAVREMIAENR